MENNARKKYAPISKSDFLKIFKESLNLVEDEFIFLTKAYYEKDNVVAIYENENNLDCYFQLPEYTSKLIPEDRRFIYTLPKNTLHRVSKSKAPDGRFNISVEHLIKVADPYSESKLISFKTRTDTKGSESISIFSQIKKLDKVQLVAVINAASNELLTK